jgi:hypothetical protein
MRGYDLRRDVAAGNWPVSRARALLLIGLLTATACGSNAESEANRSVSTSDGTLATTDQAEVTTDGTLATTDRTVVTTDQAEATTSDTQSGAQDTIDLGSGVPEALRFRAPLVGGGEIDMSMLADRPVVLWFWAPY